MAFSGASDPYADLIPKDKKKAAALAAGDPYADLIPKNKRKSGAQTGDPYADLIPKETGAGGGHGFIEESELAEIFDAGGRVVGKLRKGEVATAYNEMVRAAAAAGIELRPTSAGDTYRGPNVYSDPSVRQKVEAGYAAPPGKSPHNLGEAVDFLESPGVKEWLAKNAGRFGFRLGGSKYGLHVEWVGLPKVPGLGPELQPSAGFAGYAGTPQAAVPGRGLIELLKQATGVHEAYETPEKLRIQALQRDLRDLRKMLESAQRVYATTPAEIQKILKEVSDMARRRDQLERELKAEYGDRWRTAPDLKFRYREWERLGRELSDRLERDRPLTLRNIPNLTFRMQAAKERMDRLQAEIRTKEKELADITARIPGRARANEAISGALKLRPAHANEIRRAVELFAPIDEKKLPADPQQAADIVRGRWAEIPKRVAALEALSKQVGEDSPARDVLRKLIEQGRREQDRMASLLQTTYKSTRAPGGVLVRKPNTKTFAEIIASSADPQAAADNLRRIISRDIAPGLDPENPQTYEEVYHTYAHRRPFRTVEGRDVLHELPVLDEEMRLRLLRRKGDERPPQEYVDADWEIEGDYDGHVAVGRVLIGLMTGGVSEVVRRILPSKGEEQTVYSLGRAVMNLYSGMESLIAGIVGFIETGAGARRESPISDFIMEHAREIGSKDDTFLDTLLKGAGSMLPMLATGGMAAGATGSLLRGTALMNSARGVNIAKGLASLTGAGSAALLEAGAEAEHVRRGMLQAGASYDEAQRGAIQSFLANLAVLWVTNKLGIFSEKAGSLRKVLLSSSMEGLQEAIQQMISNEATGAPLLDGVLEAAGVGAILGSGASVVESARQRAEWTKRDQENLEEIAAAARDAYARYKESEAEKKARPEPAPGESWQEFTARGHTMTQEEYVRLASEKARLERADKRLPDAEMTGAAAMFAHRKLVAQALEEGKRVPDNVLEEFLSSGGTLPKTGLHPDIAAKYAQARTGSRVAAGKEEIIDRVFAPADAHAYRQLQTALEKAPSVDARNRIADLMGKLEQKLAPEDLRQLVGEEEFARRSVSAAPAKGKAGRLVDVAAGTARSQPQARKVAVGEAIPGPVGRATRPRSVIEPGKKFEARYRVVELDDLVPSNLDDFTTNPAFPAELQPRDRDRMALRQQVETIAREFNVDQALEDIPRLSAGTPTIAADGTVISGNGRTMAFRRVRSARPEVWAEYKRQLAERADEFGIDASELAGMRDPVLVRELGPGEDVRFAAEDANESEAAEMSAFERSLADAKKLDPVAVESMFVPASGGIEAALRSRQNDRLVQSFVSAIPMNQRSKMMDAEGGLSREGMERLEDALFAYVYGEQKSGRLHEMAVESKDERLSNLIRALKASLPAVARTESLVKQGERDASLSIVGDVVAAAEVLNRLRIQKTPVEMYVRQLSLEEKRELTPTQETLLVLFDANKRGYRALAEVFDEYSRLVWESAHTDQGAMFDLGPPDKHTLLRAAINEVGARFDEALQVREEVDEYRVRLLEEFDPEKVEHVPDTWGESLDIVSGDRIRWTEPVFGGSFKRPKFLGERTVEGLVIRESYGADRARHSFSIRVDQSSGFDALPAGKVIVRRGKTLYGNSAEVLDWADKDLYNAVREEKHERGESAKARARGIVREENLWYNKQADQIHSEGALAPPETKATGADAERVQHLSDVGSDETAPGAAAAPEGPSLLDSDLRQLAMFGGPEPINKAVDITPFELRQPAQNSLFGTLPNGDPVYIKKGPTPGAPGHLVLPGMEHLTQFVPEVAPKEERSKGSEEQRHFMEILDNRFGEDVVSECLQAYTTRDGVNFDQVENAITIYARTRQREARESARQREARESARQREAREAGREGVDPGRRGGREDEAEILVIAESIDRSILARGTAELHGRRVSDPGELARLLQVVRGSIEGEIFEVLRVIYVNDQDVVVGSDAWSSRLPSASSFQIQGMDPEETVEWLHRRMRAVGGSGFWLVHNHPSGVSMPSNADLTLTESVAEWLPGFRGHVIINSGNYAHIRVNEQGEAEFAVFGMPDVTDPLYAVPQPKAGEWLGFNIKNPSQLVIYSQAVLKSSGYLLTVHDAKGGVQAIYEVPLEFFDRDVSSILQRLKALAAPMGGRDVSIAALSIPLRHRRKLRELSFDPIVFDVVDGYGYSQAAENARQGLVGLPRLPLPPGVLIEEETSSYATDIFQNIDPFVVYLARVAAEVGAATATKSKAVMMKAILDRLRTDGSAERAGPYLKAVVEQALRVSLRTSVPNADVILDAPERGRDATRPGKDPVRTWNSFFDSLEAASWARDMLESAYGGTVDLKRTHLDIEENLDRVGRVAGRVAMTVRHGWHDEFGNKLTHGLEEIKSGMEADGIPYAHWQKYRRSLRALEIFGRLPHAAQGTYIQRYLEAIETIETFRNLYDADKVKVWDDAFDLYTWHWHLEWERTGLRPQGWAAELRAENQYYYPMHPMPDPDSVMMRELNPSKLASPLAENVRAIGLEEKMDGFTAMAWETERVIRAGAINRAVAPFAEAAAANPLMAGVVEDVTERQIGARKKAETREAGSASDSLEDALREALDQVDQMVAAMQRPLEEGVDPIVTLFHNGEPRQYKLDPLLWAAIRGQAPEVVNELVNLLKIPAKLFRGGTTKYNPNFFLLNNPILDITHSMVVHGLNPLLWPKGLFIASRGMRLQVYRQWLMANGQFDQSGVRDFVDREWLYDPTARDALETFIDKALQTRGVKPIANVFLGIFNVLGRGGQIMEEATRLTMFTQRLRHYRSQGIEETRAMELAAQDAAELMNFGRAGKAGRSLWGRMTPFFNISAQVLRSAKLGLKRSPAAFITRGFLLITVPKILEYLAYGDDEEYQRLPNYIRFGGYVFRINGQWYCLRFPYELGAMFAATPQLALDIEAGKLTEREALSKGARIAGESVRPNLVPQAAQILAAQQLFSESGAVVDVSFGRVMGYPVPEGVDGDLYRYSVLQAGLIFGALGRQGARTAGYGLGLETSIPSPLGRFHPSPMPITYDVLIEPRNREILRAFGVQLYPPKRWKSELSKEDFEQRVREQARAIDEGVASLVMSEGWRKMSRQERAEALEKIVDDARDDVRRERLKMDKLSGESVVKKVMERAGVKE